MDRTLTESQRKITDFVRKNPGKTTRQIIDAVLFAKSRVHYVLVEFCDRWELPREGNEKMHSRYVWVSKGHGLDVAGAKPAPSIAKLDNKHSGKTKKTGVGPVKPNGVLPWWWGVETAELNSTAT